MKFVTIFLTLCLTTTMRSARIHLPHFITPCQAEDNDCFKNTLIGLGPHFKEGIPEFNFGSLEPLNFPDHNQSDVSSPVMPYAISLTNIQYTGASDFQVPKFTVDLDELKLNLIIIFPKLVMTSYEIVWVKGFGFEVDGQGPVTETYKNVTVNLLLNGAKPLSKAKRHLNWREGDISVSLGEVSFEVNPSFSNDGYEYQQILNIASSKFPESFNPEMEVFIKNTVGYFILRSLNTVHAMYPADVLYPSEK